MSDDFSVFTLTEGDRQHAAYGMCVLGWVVSGMIAGSMAGGMTLPGATGGAVWALFTCKALAQPIKRKLFSVSDRLSEPEFAQALLAVRTQFPTTSKTQALDILVAVRREAIKDPNRYAC